MGVVKIVISKSKAGGRPWQNEYPVKINSSLGLPDDDELRALGCGEAFTEANTDPSAPLDADNRSLIGKLLRFEQTIHYAAAITIVNVYVTDGVRQADPAPGAPSTSVFWSSPLNITAKRSGASLDTTVAPGTNVIFAKRVPAAFGGHQGHATYRGCLLDSDVIFDGDDRISFTDAATQATVAGFFHDAVVNNGLDGYFGSGGFLGNPPYDARIILGIARVRGGSSILPGSHKSDLVDVRPMADFIVTDAANRQARRGKRRPT